MSYQARNAKRAKTHTSATPDWEVDRDTERGEVFSDRTLHPMAGDKFATVDVLQAFCTVNNIQLEHATKYGEPGYTAPPRTRLIDGDILTPDDDAQEWIDSALNKPREPLPSWFDTSELQLRGFVMMDDNTNSDIARAIIKEGFEVILRRGSSSVFYEVWTRKEVDTGGAYCEYEDRHFTHK